MIKLKFIKLTKHQSKTGVLVNVNDITFVTDKIDYREVHVKLPDRIAVIEAEETLDEIYGFIEVNKTYQPIFD